MYNSTYYIQQYFNEKLNFNTKSYIVPARNGFGIDQIIISAKLPESVKYKQLCIYDLIEKIELEISGNKIFSYSSKQLLAFDTLNKTYESVKLLNSNSGNTVYYPIDLRIFGESICENNVGVFDLAYNGIRLCDVDNNSVKLYVKCSSIFSIITPALDPEENPDIAKLDLTECSAIIRYRTDVNINGIIPQHIQQKLSIWCPQTEDLYGALPSRISSVKYRLCFTPWTEFNISKLVLINNSNSKIKSFTMMINGVDCFSRLVCNDLTRIYQYNNNHTENFADNVYVVDLDTVMLYADDTIQVNIDFVGKVTVLNVEIFAKINTSVYYENNALEL